MPVFLLWVTVLIGLYELIFKVYFIDYAITVVPFFLPFISLCPVPSFYPPPSIPPFMSMGHTYKFFTFSISYTILNLPLSILYLSTMLLIPCTFSAILPLLLPVDNSPCDLHFCDSVPLLVVSLVCFWFLGSVVDSCHFTTHIFYLFLFLR